MKFKGQYIILVLSLMLLTFTSALSVNIPVATNYSLINTNHSNTSNYAYNSGLLQGFTPQQVANLFVELEPNWNGNYTSFLSLFNWNKTYADTLYYSINNPYNFYNSTTLPTPTEPLWNANYSDFLNKITWSQATNGTLALSSAIPTNNNQLINGNNYYNSTNPQPTANIFDQWLNQSSYVRHGNFSIGTENFYINQTAPTQVNLGIGSNVFMKFNTTRGTMSIGPSGNALPTTTALLNMYKQENIVEGSNVLAATLDNLGQSANLTNLYTFYFSSSSRPPLQYKISSIYGIFGQTSDIAGSYGWSDNMYGGYFAAQKRGNRTTSALGGSRSYPQLYAGSALVSNVYGYNTLGYMENPTTSATNWYDYQSGSFPVGGNITNHYDFYATAPTIGNGATLNNSYGVYINKMTGNLSQHAIYINGVGDGAELNWNNNRTILDNGTSLVINPQGGNSGILYMNGSTYTNGNANISGNLTVNGILTDNSNTNITGNLNVLGNFSAKRPYYSGYDNSTQPLISPTAAQVINITNNNDVDNWYIYVVNKQNLTFGQTGDYVCILSPEFYEPNGQSGIVTFWIQKNGVDVPWSNSRFTLSSNFYSAPSITYQFDIDNPATDNIRFMWWSDNANTILYSSGTLTNPSRPSIPAVLINCQKVSEVTP